MKLRENMTTYEKLLEKAEFDVTFYQREVNEADNKLYLARLALESLRLREFEINEADTLRISKIS